MGIVSIKNIYKSFGRKNILQDISLEINEKDILGIIGPSGSGKSVLAKIIIGFLTPDDGEMFLNSSKKVGFSMQNNSLYENLTVKQNLIYFSKIYGTNKEQRKKMIPIILTNLNLQEYEKILVKNLSGGTKKRVDIACTLINNPEVIVLDEPFLGLDPILIENLSRFLISLNNEGKTIIITSHRVNELSRICTRVALVKNKTLKEINKTEIRNAYK